MAEMVVARIVPFMTPLRNQDLTEVRVFKLLVGKLDIISNFGLTTGDASV
jgi:hypothetical protein